MSKVKLKIFYDEREQYSTLSLATERSEFLKKVKVILKKHFNKTTCDTFFIGCTPEKANNVLIEVSVQKQVGISPMEAATTELHALSTKDQLIGVEMRPVEIIV